MKLENNNYYYLNRLYDVIYYIHEKYNIPYKKCLNVFNSDAGNQIEIKGTARMSVKDRIEIHKGYLKLLWKKRNDIGTKQLKLW